MPNLDTNTIYAFNSTDFTCLFSKGFVSLLQTLQLWKREKLSLDFVLVIIVIIVFKIKQTKKMFSLTWPTLKLVEFLPKFPTLTLTKTIRTALCRTLIFKITNHRHDTTRHKKKNVAFRSQSQLCSSDPITQIRLNMVN